MKRKGNSFIPEVQWIVLCHRSELPKVLSTIFYELLYCLVPEIFTPPMERICFITPLPPPPCGSPKLTLYIALHFFKTLPPPLQFLIWIFFWNYALVNGSRSTKHSHLAPVVQTLDSAIHRINQYPADKY